MKKYCTKLLVFGMLLLLPFLGFYIVLFAMPDHYTGSIAGTIHYKLELLDTTPAPRILFVGGSSSPYGTVCETVQEHFDMPALCLGSTAYMGLEYYLNMVEHKAQSGDIVVLALENILLKSDGMHAGLVWEAAGNDPNAWSVMPLSYYPELFQESYAYYQSKKGQLTQGKRDYHQDFGPLGDVVTYRETLLASGYNTQDEIYLDGAYVDASICENIKEFTQKMKKQNVEVVFAFAPLNALAVRTTNEQNASFESTVLSGIETPCILDLNTSIMEGKYFYDSNNHLTSEGAAINTQNLIDGLEQVVFDAQKSE